MPRILALLAALTLSACGSGPDIPVQLGEPYPPQVAPDFTDEVFRAAAEVLDRYRIEVGASTASQ